MSDATRTKVLSQLKEMGYGNLIKKVSAPAGTNLAFIIYKRHGEILDLHPFFLLLMENIEKYYTEKNGEYDFSSKNGLRKYIEDILG